MISSHKRGNWKCAICGQTRPKCEWAQIIGHVAATHGYKSREKNERWGIPEEEIYRAKDKENKRTKSMKS